MPTLRLTQQEGATRKAPRIQRYTAVGTHLHELCVDLGWERRVCLELGPQGREIQRRHVRDENNGVRVAHADTSNLPFLAVHLAFDVRRGIGIMRVWAGVGGERVGLIS